MSFDLLSPQFLEAVTVTLGSLQAVYFHRAFENKQLETELKELKQWIKEIHEKQTTITKPDHEIKEPFQQQGKERKEFPQKEEFQKVDAPEKAPPAKEQQQAQLRHEIEAQRQREAQEQAREQVRQTRQPDVQKPDYADVQKAEAARNAYEQKELRDGQQKAKGDVFAAIDKKGMGAEEAAAAKEEMRKALEQRFKEQQERLAREQKERGERQAQLYRER